MNANTDMIMHERGRGHGHRKYAKYVSEFTYVYILNIVSSSMPKKK
jgi:hypothetical protein